MPSHGYLFLKEAEQTLACLGDLEIDQMASLLSKIEGRIYMIGLGGSLANCIHFAADLRNLCNIDAVAPTNLAELTANANDYGWDQLFRGYMRTVSSRDALFVMSVGGGTAEVSVPLSIAIRVAKSFGAKIFGIVGPQGGATADFGDFVIRIPMENRKHVTPLTEAFQMVIAHCLVSHPLLQRNPTKW